MNPFQQFLDKISTPPKRIFLTDGFGALVSAFLLGVVLVKFQHYIGMPTKILYFLAILPCFFAIYSFSCYFFIKDNWRPFLKIIAWSNLFYCFLSAGCIIYYYQELTNLGNFYFLVEITIVLILIRLEIKIATFIS